MSTIQSERQLLIPSFQATFKHRIVTSFVRNKGSLLFVRTSLPFFLFVLVFVAVPSNGIKIEAAKSNLLANSETAMKRNRKMDTSINDLTQLQRNLLTDSCVNCLPSEKIKLLFEPYNDLRSNALRNLLTRRKNNLRIRPCNKLSYTRCTFLYNLTKTFVKASHDAYSNFALGYPKKLTKTSMLSNLFSKVGSSSTAPPATRSPSKSRKRRLARGDWRLVHMYCRTNFVLEILDDGRVVGNPTKTDDARLEIQPVAPRGVVRLYSPATQYFLAMDNRGRLFGTKTYNEEHCAFVERIQENWWTTYSSQTLPNKKKRRSKRSASRAWYVAIGKSGLPRKASRIRPSQSSAQFLPRPV